MFGTIFTYICKNANAKVELYSPTSVLSMGTRIKNPMSLKIALGYNYRNWHFTINTKNPFMNNKTTIEYNRDRYYKNSHQYSPRISTNMFTEDFALRVPPFHSRGTVRLTLMVPSISERWYWYQASEMSAVKRCSITDVA